MVELSSGRVSIKAARALLLSEYQSGNATRRIVVYNNHQQFAYRRIDRKAGKHVVI